jgi:undecaprenyl diphosphate synthase
MSEVVLNQPPQHIACIMDGNRRWAKQQGKPSVFGHTKGAEQIEHIARHAIARGISFVTLYALSTENLQNRSETELKHLFALIKKLPQYLKDIMSEGVKIETIGDLSALPNDCQQVLNEAKEQTKTNTTLTLTLAVNYGGRDELVRAVSSLLQTNISPDDLTESHIAKALDYPELPDPELIIRTGGKQRLSNFLLWQSAYSELYFTDTFWPAFDPEALDAAITWYHQAGRNFGK